MDLRLYSTDGFDRGAPRWKEALWFVARLLFFLNPIPWPSALRCALLRLFGATVGKRVVIRAGTNITFPWRVKIGEDVWIGEETVLLSLAEIRIGSSVCLSQRTFLCTGSHDHRREDFALITKPITISAGCWVAAMAFIGPGVTLGQGAVVSAGSVVLRDVPAGQIARGNPAVWTA